MSTTPSDLFKLFDKLVSKPYHINRFFVKIAGSITDGFLLTQLTYLYQQKDYQPFSPRDGYLREKYDLGDKELRGSRARLKAKGLISTQLAGVPAKLHYTINIDKIIELALQLPSFKDLIAPSMAEAELPPSLPKRDKLELTKGTDCVAGKGQTINNTSNNSINNKTNTHARAPDSLNPEAKARAKAFVDALKEGEKSKGGGEFDLQPSPPTRDVVDEMMQLGLSESRSRFILQSKGVVAIVTALDITKARAKTNPAAYFEQALARGWTLTQPTEVKKEPPKTGTRLNYSVLETQKYLEATQVRTEALKSADIDVQGHLAKARAALRAGMIENRSLTHAG